jgi:hypothetical protein
LSAVGSGAEEPLAAPGTGHGARVATGSPDPLAAWVFAALVLACFAAFAITQHLKHTPTPVQRFEMPPWFEPSAAGGPHSVEHLSFRIASSDEVTVAIVNSSEDVVATLLRDRPLARYTQLSFQWDGRRSPTTVPVPAAGTPHDRLVPIDRGPLAPPGEYRVRVTLLHQHLTRLSPRSFELRRNGSA